MLKDVEAKFRGMLPHEGGLLALVTHSAKKISQKYKKLCTKNPFLPIRAFKDPPQKKGLAYFKLAYFKSRVGNKGEDYLRVRTIIIILQGHNYICVTV